MKFSLLLIALLSSSAMAAIYSYRDADGNLVYTDEPVAGVESTKVDVAEPMVIQAFGAENAEQGGVDGDTTSAASEDGTWASWGSENADADAELSAGESAVAVPEVRLAAPLDDQAFWTGNGDFDVSIELTPGLGAGQELAVLLDGTVRARGLTRQMTLSAVDRGTHTLQVEVRDTDDKAVAASDSVTVHVLRPSVVNRGSSLMHPSVAQTDRPASAEAAPAVQ